MCKFLYNILHRIITMITIFTLLWSDSLGVAWSSMFLYHHLEKNNLLDQSRCVLWLTRIDESRPNGETCRFTFKKDPCPYFVDCDWQCTKWLYSLSGTFSLLPTSFVFWWILRKIKFISFSCNFSLAKRYDNCSYI